MSVETSREHLLEEMFVRTKSYLMSANKDGVSVYDQLTRLMEQLLNENPDDIAYDPSRFNEVFTLLQQHSFVNGQSTAACNEPCPVPPSELARLEENQRLFERPPPETETTVEQPDPYTTVTTTRVKPLTAPEYESVAKQNPYWSWTGCGMAEEEAFLLDRSITMLAMEKQLAEVRFVGKVFGTRGNYYIVSCRRYVQEDEKVYKEINTMPKPARRKLEVPVQAEPGFVGVNRLSFWVTAHPAAAWTLLPDVTPQQICSGRQVKRLFSGDLNAAVTSSPPFPWPEAVYLRVQLSRIVSGTFISPTGALEEPEDDAENEYEDEEDEDPRKPREAKYRPLTQLVKGFATEEEMDVAQWARLDQWLHSEGYLYKNGRQTKVPEKPEVDEEEEEEEQEGLPEEEEDEEPDEDEEEEEEKELFTPIQSDFLHAVVDIPEAPKVDEEDEEDEEEMPQDDANEPAEGEEGENDDDKPPKPVLDDDVPDDDPTKVKIAAWTVRVVNNTSKKHRVVVVKSLRWPGAVAFAADGGKRWGCVYFGNGLKKTDFSFTPMLAPPVLPECADITEAQDPTPATEKLVRRGEEPPEPDSEDEPEPDEEDEENEN